MLTSSRVRTWQFLSLPSLLWVMACGSLAPSTPPEPGQIPDGLRVPRSEDAPAPRSGTALPWIGTLAEIEKTVSVPSLRSEVQELWAEAWLEREGVERPRVRAQVTSLGRPPQDLSETKSLGGVGPQLLTSFESMDIAECCFEDALNPPDPEIAAGSDHVIAVVNSSVEIYEKTGTSVFGPMPLEIFFAGLGTSCDDRVFDPNSVYDEDAERYIVGADGSGAAYCVAVSATSDPMGEWHFYKFPTNIDGKFFDFPHIGVGRDALYMAAKMIPGARAIMWAFDKTAMYQGLPADFMSQEVGVGTLQPLHLHGARQGTWPVAGPHYLMLDGSTLGTFEMFSWEDPLGNDISTSLGEIDVAAVHGAQLFTPIGSPQQGGNTIRSGDGRVLDFEYRDGSGWITNVAACQPDANSFVNCVQWAEIDLATATVIQAGVFGSPGEHRTYSDLAVDRCGGMAVGYSKFTNMIFPSTAVAGRDVEDPLGMVSGETLLKAGEALFFDTGANSWGDYTGMTIDPEGTTFWYLGEYSKDIPAQDRSWGTFVGSFALPTCSRLFGDGFEDGDTSGWSDSVP